MAGKLTAVKAAKARGPATLHDGGGLYLRVSKTGSKSWVFRFQIDGKRRDMGLGGFPDISLADARALAAEHRKRRQGGIDPLETRRAQRQAQRLAEARGRTFRQRAVEYMAKNRSAWRSAKHAGQWAQTLEKHVYPILGELPVAAIDTGLVVRVLDPIWSTKPETASRVRGRIETVLDAATAQGFRSGPNPAQWKGTLAHILPARSKLRKVIHYPALPFSEMPAFVAELRQQQGMAARALQFVIFTVGRSNEILGARWREIDESAKVWAVPSERMKAGRAHRVPLSDPALAILESARPLAVMRDGRPDPDAPLFPGERRALPLSSTAMRALLRRMKRESVTVHGMRSAFRDWVSEATAFQGELAEGALAHLTGDAAERAYRRGDALDRRRELMAAWARFCDGSASAEVVPLRTAAQ